MREYLHLTALESVHLRVKGDPSTYQSFREARSTIIMSCDSHRHSKSIKMKYVYTALIYFCYLTPGLQNIVAITLVDVAELTESTVATVSIGLSVMYVGYCIGSLIIGWLLDRVNRQLALLVAVAGSAAAYMLIPIVKSLPYYFAALFVNGMLYVAVDVASFAWIIEMWEPKDNPYMQALFLFNSIGFSLSAALAAPFLSYSVNETLDDGSTISVFHESRIMIPYAITASIAVFASFSMSVMYLKSPYVNDRDSSTAVRQTLDPVVSEVRKSPASPMCKVLACLMLASSAALIINIGSFVSVFGVYCDIHVSKASGALMANAFSISACFAMCLNAWIATKVSSKVMLYTGLAITLAAVLMMMIAAYTKTEILLWISMPVTAFGLVPILPSTYSFLASEMTVTNTMFGGLTFGKSILRILIPLLTGSLIESHAIVYVFVSLITLLLSFLFLVTLNISIHRSHHRNHSMT